MAEMSMPSGFGGLMRYNEEYNSKLKFKPEIVILLIILTILFVIGLKVFYPVAKLFLGLL